MSVEKRGRRLIQAVQRAVQILDCFDPPDKGYSLGELSSLVSLNKSTAHGIINTLVECSYIVQDPSTGKYHLGSKLLEKGLMMLERLDVPYPVHPHLERIADKHQNTAHLYLYVAGELYCADKVEAGSFVIISSRVGSRLPFHATASGKVVLAHLSERELRVALGNIEYTVFTSRTISSRAALEESLPGIRSTGYAIEDEEVEIGAYSIAVPIYNGRGLIGTISVSGPKNKMVAIKEQVIHDLVETASAVSLGLSARPRNH